MTTEVFTATGRKLTLGALLGKGGEGAVHHINESPDLAAKIYIAGKASERRDKITAMCDSGIAKSNTFVSFPMEPLRSSKGEFLGFTMRKVGGFKTIHDLYGPGSRKVEFPAADFRFLVQSALNLAIAVSSVHNTGCVIGDINHSGILVSGQALVNLIDSDSFQYRAAGKTFRCKVGVPEYTPAELQGASFDAVDRTANHDNFGLAVLIFQLLFLGRHPFAGRFLGTGDMDIKRAISERRFAYSARKSESRMEPPPYVPELSDIDPDIQAAFELAFSRGAESGAGRPSAASWVGMLNRLKADLKQCKAEPSHHHSSRLSSCPWCKLERSLGRPLFPAKHVTADAVMNVGDLLAQINRIPTPRNPPPAEDVVGLSPGMTISAVGKSARSERAAAIAAAFGGIAVGAYLASEINGFWGIALMAGCAFMIFRAKDLGRKFASELASATSGWEDAKKKWQAAAGPEEFTAKRGRYVYLVGLHQQLPGKERNRLQELEKKKRDLQLRKYLEGQFIDRAKISNIGPGRKATLASYGIETAWDIKTTDVTRVPGFGPARAADLKGWLATVERKFVFNASIPTDPREVQRVKSEIAKERGELERELRNSLPDLNRIADHAAGLCKTAPPTLADALTRLRQVQLDIKGT